PRRGFAAAVRRAEGQCRPALASGQAVRRLTLDQEIEGSNPSSPASYPAGSGPADPDHHIWWFLARRVWRGLQEGATRCAEVHLIRLLDVHQIRRVSPITMLGTAKLAPDPSSAHRSCTCGSTAPTPSSLAMASAATSRIGDVPKASPSGTMILSL